VQDALQQAIDNNEISTPKAVEIIIDVDEKRRAIQWGLSKRFNGEAATKREWVDPRYADGVPVYARVPEDDTRKVDLRSHTPFDATIIENKTSYLTGVEPTITDSTDDETDLTSWVKAVDMRTMVSQLVQDAAKTGEAFMLLYKKPGANDVFVTREEPYYCILLYNQDTLKPKYGLIYYTDIESKTTDEGKDVQNEIIYAYWYDETSLTVYKGMKGNLQVSQEQTAHGFPGVPLIGFYNNSHHVAETERVVGLMDIYDILDSDFSSELSQLRLAYMLMKNMGLAFEHVADSFRDTGSIENNHAIEDLLEKMKKTGVLLTDNEDAEAKFVEKTVQYEAIKYQKQDIKERIFQNSNSYDPISMQNASGDTTAFQVQQTMFNMEQSAAQTALHFRKALMYMVSLLSDYYTIDMDALQIEFKRNVPSNILEDIKKARESGFQMSQKQIAKRLPFDIDQEQNAEELRQEADSVMLNPLGDFDNAGNPSQ
jgi:SPP1 family phage portal protein